MKQQQRIGIWGFGVVGKAVLEYCQRLGLPTSIIDQKPLGAPHSFPENCTLYASDKLEQFLHDHDRIIASPGIDLTPYQDHAHKWLTELDLFHASWHKPYIAVTGSIGKTGIVTLLQQALTAAGKKVAVGGNIGTGMLSLIPQQSDVDYAVLEVSSFQLEHVKSAHPTLGILTSFSPNHLDRHHTEQAYFNAKAQLFAHQTIHDHALLPYDLASRVTTAAHVHTFADNSLNAEYRLHDQKIMQHHKLLTQLEDLAPTAFNEQWLIVSAALDILNLSLSALPTVKPHQLEHRREYITTHNGITFYNDSKATVAQATLGAIASLGGEKILLLGGLSKGADRAPLVAALHNNVHTIICFGAEAQQLNALCTKEGIPSRCVATLDDAFALSVQLAQSHFTIILSPAGSSFDLFSNYQERGNHFKHLVHTWVTKGSHENSS